MDNPKAKLTTNTNISWRDELSYSYDTRSEGLEKLKEAIKLAKASTSSSESSPRDSSKDED